MPLLRQGGYYLRFGVLQLLLDWLLLVALTALGMPVAPANLASRTSAALLGFWLNGRYTFADGNGQRLGWRRFPRFCLLLLFFFSFFTVLVAVVASRLGLHQAWLAKPLVETGLAVVSFFALRHWVFR